MRNITLGILAHVDAGKTTLSESILYNTGVIRQMGRVDKKDAFLDTNVMEKERGITIFSKQALFKLSNEVNVTLLDTPGHVDFSPEAERTLWVLDYAILVISALDGVTGHTKALFSLLESHNIPVFIFVNKMDQPGANKERILDEIKSELTDKAVDFCGRQDEMFYEDIASLDELLMDKYLDGQTINADDIRNLINNTLVYPVFWGSALKNEGVDALLEGLLSYCKITEDVKELGARIYKITHDVNGERVTHLKLTGGELKVRDILGDEKITGIKVINGNKSEPANECLPGGVYALYGLNNTYGGMGIGYEEDAPKATFEPVMVYKVIIPGDMDPGQMMPKLSELQEELPELHVLWDEELKEIHISIMGEIQLEIIRRLIWDRYAVEVSFGAGKIVYKETIANAVVGVGHFEPLRHYAEVQLKLEPGERGSGIQVFTEANVDEFALNWQRLVMTHVMEKTHRGVLLGAPLTDVKVTVLTGKAHIKHTVGGDFRQATYRAIRQALMQARSVVLEPYFNFILNVPEQYVGRAMTDLDRKGVSFTGPEILGNGFVLLTGKGAVSSLQDYPNDVQAYSGGMGTISLSYGGYDICNNAEAVILERGYVPEADIRNSPDSVFCMHGAATIVPWDQVFKNMHMPFAVAFDEDGNISGRVVVDKEAELEKAAVRAQSLAMSRNQSQEVFIGYEEVDAIVAGATGANAKSQKREGNSRIQGDPGWRRQRKYGDMPEKNEGNESKKISRPSKNRDKYMLVDGYNVIHAWKELHDLAGDNLDGARGRLLDILCNYQAIKGMNLIAVFDAYRVKGNIEKTESYHNINVVYTREAETADAYIEKFTHENGKKYDITVVTSDGVEQIIIMGNGCSLMSSREFEQDVKRVNEQIRETHIESNSTKGVSFMDNLTDEGRAVLDKYQ